MSELATYQEVKAGTDNQRTITPQALKDAGIKVMKVTRGTVTTLNRSNSISSSFHNNFNYNYANVYPPSGYSMSNLVGFIPSIAWLAFSGDVNYDDRLWCRYQILSTRVKVTCQISENHTNSKINYLAIWQK